MTKVVILGAGVMGSALTFPLHENKHDVNLWGTEYDTRIIEDIRKTGVHPRLKLKLLGVKTFLNKELDEATQDRKVAVLAVSSAGIKSITKRLVPYLEDGMIIVSVAKGLEELDGKITTISEIIYNSLPEALQENIPIVVVGGPSIAKEVALRMPTAVVFASNNSGALRNCQRTFGTDNYRVTISQDVVGIEICAASKNLYAIPVGICDGLMKRRGQKTMNNTKALIFSYAVGEMRRFVTAMGGKEESVLGLAGIGDLEVTCKGGRNSLFGCLLGSGMKTDEALNEMQRKGLTVEGYLTTKKAYKLALQLEMKGKLKVKKDLPLLSMVYNILYNNRDVVKEMTSFISKLK